VNLDDGTLKSLFWIGVNYYCSRQHGERSSYAVWRISQGMEIISEPSTDRVFPPAMMEEPVRITAPTIALELKHHSESDQVNSSRQHL